MMYPSLPVAQRALESSSLRRRSDGAVVAGWPAAIATMNQACVPWRRIAVPPNRPFPGGQHSNLPKFYRHISGARRGVHIALPAPVPLPWMGVSSRLFANKNQNSKPKKKTIASIAVKQRILLVGSYWNKEPKTGSEPLGKENPQEFSVCSAACDAAGELKADRAP